MSNDKYDAITGSGIEVGERVKIPDELVPADARVEIEAKIAAGYFTDGARARAPTTLAQRQGARALSEHADLTRSRSPPTREALQDAVRACAGRRRSASAAPTSPRRWRRASRRTSRSTAAAARGRASAWRG